MGSLYVTSRQKCIDLEVTSYKVWHESSLAQTPLQGIDTAVEGLDTPNP